MEVKKRYYRIHEVSELIDIPISTIRYWESEFPQLAPKRTPTGHRRYNQGNIEVLKRIKFLLRENKMSLDYAKTYLANYRKYPPRGRIACKSNNDVTRLLAEVKGRTEDPHIIVRIEAIERFLLKK